MPLWSVSQAARLSEPSSTRPQNRIILKIYLSVLFINIVNIYIHCNYTVIAPTCQYVYKYLNIILIFIYKSPFFPPFLPFLPCPINLIFSPFLIPSGIVNVYVFVSPSGVLKAICFSAP